MSSTLCPCHSPEIGATPRRQVGRFSGFLALHRRARATFFTVLMAVFRPPEHRGAAHRSVSTSKHSPLSAASVARIIRPALTESQGWLYGCGTAGALHATIATPETASGLETSTCGIIDSGLMCRKPPVCRCNEGQTLSATLGMIRTNNREFITQPDTGFCLSAQDALHTDIRS
jgi:hypothetical protein